MRERKGDSRWRWRIKQGCRKEGDEDDGGSISMNFEKGTMLGILHMSDWFVFLTVLGTDMLDLTIQKQKSKLERLHQLPIIRKKYIYVLHIF